MNDGIEMFATLCEEEGIVEKHLKQVAGHDAKESVDLDLDLSRAKFSFVVSGLIAGFNESMEKREFGRAVVFHSLIHQFLDVDEEVAETFEAAQQQPENPLEAMMEEADGVMGGTIEFDTGFDDEFR